MVYECERCKYYFTSDYDDIEIPLCEDCLEELEHWPSFTQDEE